jgi:hypothetical protein
MQLDIIHEKAIDLFVAGKRQHEVASELNVTTRTIRRWCEDEEFSNALSTQHRITRNLELGERAQVGRDRRDIHRKTMEQLLTLLSNTDAPPSLRAVCLKLGMQDAQFDQRQFEAQEWRERVHAERAAERRASQAATQELMNARGMLNRSEKFLDAMKVNREQAIATVRAEDPVAENRNGSGVPTASRPQKSARPAAANATQSVVPQPPRPAVKPVSPIRNSPQNRTKADKTGHALRSLGVPPGPRSMHAETRDAGLAIIDRISAEVVRASFDRDKLRPDFRTSQLLVHTLAKCQTHFSPQRARMAQRTAKLI